MKPPLKGEGNRRQTVEGFLWNLLLGVKDLRSYPSVKPTACQLSFQGSRMKPPLKGEGEPSSDGGGVLVESFA